MPSTILLHPTLWRTCRVIANRSRLRIFALLIRQPGQTVSAIADRSNLPIPVASQYLRVLEARGLLEVRRVGRRVSYRLSSTITGGRAQGIVEAMLEVFRRDPKPVEALFKTATAFTHPRRIEIFRTIQRKPQTLHQLHDATGIPLWTLRRHLKKLEARAFVASWSGNYVAANRPDAFGRELARLAAE